MSDKKDLTNSDSSLYDLPDISQSNENRINVSWTNMMNLHTSAESNNNLTNSFFATDRSIRRRNDNEMLSSQLSRLSISDAHGLEQSDISHNIENISISLEIPSLPLPVSELQPDVPLPYGNEDNNNIENSISISNSMEISNSLQRSNLLDSNELFQENEIPSNIYNSSIESQQHQQQQPLPYHLPYPNPISELNITEPPIIQPSFQQQYQSQYQHQPPPTSPPPPASLQQQKSKSSQQSHQSLLDLPLPSSCLDIDLDTYNIIDPEFTQEDVYEYIKSTKENVTCSKCGKEIKKNQSFGKDDTRYYLCIPCSIAEINNDKKVKQNDWEESIKAKSKNKKKEDEPPPPAGYRRCSRMAHYKRKWSFIERDKQKGKNKNKVIKNKYALKIEKQCLYCRNFKKRQNLIKKLKKESFEQMKKEYEDENDNLYDDKIYDDDYIGDDDIEEGGEEEGEEEEEDDEEDDNSM